MYVYIYIYMYIHICIYIYIYIYMCFTREFPPEHLGVDRDRSGIVLLFVLVVVNSTVMCVFLFNVN